LRLSNAFFGLVAQGWDITRLTDRDVRAILPPEGLWTEFVVGLVQTERLATEPLSVADFNDLLEKEKENFGLKYDRQLTDDELLRIRQIFLEKYSEWRALKPGESMSMNFGD